MTCPAADAKQNKKTQKIQESYALVRSQIIKSRTSGHTATAALTCACTLKKGALCISSSQARAQPLELKDRIQSMRTTFTLCNFQVQPFTPNASSSVHLPSDGKVSQLPTNELASPC